MPQHMIAPVYNNESKLLILGSFPSVKSREAQFFYGHPKNRFWRVLSAVLGCKVPETQFEKRELLLSKYIALWDVIASCDISGSADNTISNVVPNDLSRILDCASIEKIYTNGSKAHELYRKYLLPATGIAAFGLPSTSPANAKFSIERLIEEWKTISE